MPMTKEDWQTVEKSLDVPYSKVELMCDGYRVALQLTPMSKSRHVVRYMIMVYVDGWMRYEWLNKDCEERRRFLCPCERFSSKPKQRAALKRIQKQLSKKRMREMGLDTALFDPDHKFTYWNPYWTSFRALKRHLVANNVEIILAWTSKDVATIEEVGDVQAM